MSTPIPEDFLRENLHYEPSTGNLTWKKKVPYRRVGANAVTKAKGGGIVKVFSHSTIKANRVAWFLVFGEFPIRRLIYVNGVYGDNRVENLAEALPKYDVPKEFFTYKDLTRFLDYNPETGRITRKKDGSYAEHGHHSGYLFTKVRGAVFSSHRLAWILHYGYEPENEIDHKNGIRTDNRIDNLREVTRGCNMWNKKVYKGSTSGYKGVSFDGKTKVWRCYGAKNGRTIYLGIFEHKFDAVVVRLCWESENPSLEMCDRQNVNVIRFKEEYPDLYNRVLNSFT